MQVTRKPIENSKSVLNVLRLPGGGGMVWAVASARDTSADFDGQTRDVLDALEGLLKEAGTDHAHMVKAEVVVTNHDNKPAFDAIWREWVPSDRGPVRSFVESRMPDGDLVEVIVTATLPEGA